MVIGPAHATNYMSPDQKMSFFHTQQLLLSSNCRQGIYYCNGHATLTEHIQGGQSPVMITFPDFQTYLLSIDLCNSNNTKLNACYFTL